MTTPISVLIVDDHVFYREGVKTLLATRSDEITVVGECATGEEALRLAALLGPDVVLMDLKMPGRGGLNATEQLTAAHPEVAVLVLTMLDDDSVLPALRAGARGYLLKDASVDDLVRGIVAVHRGETILSKTAADHVQRRLAQGAFTPSRPFPQLSDREHDLLREILRGRNTDEIARTLGLRPKTVRNYVSNILVKLHARDRAELVIKARESGYPEP
jgi:DNA-binding NarL/FixJ family response regulator